MAELFISYSKSDRQPALDLVTELRAKGFSVWIDQGGIGGAKNWSSEIVEALNACSTVVLLLSSHSIASHNVAKEIQLASEKRKNILPVVIERVTLPIHFEFPLAGIQRVHYQDRPAIFHALEMLHGIETARVLPATREKDQSIRVAVLPFDDLSPQSDNQWFADGMMDELISTLGSLDRVKVPSRSDVLHYRNQRVKSWDIAREIGVRYLIEGAVRKAGEKIRINASLIDALGGGMIWSNKFDGSFEDVFAFQETVARQVVSALQLTLSPNEEHNIELRFTGNAEAYALYLKGQHEQHYLAKESYLRALERFEQAVTLDPTFTRAYISIASLCCAYYREYSKDPSWLKRAEASLAEAQRLSGETSRTLMIRGMIAWLRGNSHTAIETLTASIHLDPKNHNAFNILGSIYATERNYPAARDAFQKVVDLVPNTTAYFNLLVVLGQAHDNNRRAEVARAALHVFDTYLLHEPADQNAAVSRAFVLWWAEQKEAALQAAEELFVGGKLSGNAVYNLGCLYSELGYPDRYLLLLRTAIDRGYREFEQTKNFEFETKELAAQYEPEFQSLLKEMTELIEREQKVPGS